VPRGGLTKIRLIAGKRCFCFRVKHLNTFRLNQCRKLTFRWPVKNQKVDIAKASALGWRGPAELGPVGNEDRFPATGADRFAGHGFRLVKVDEDPIRLNPGDAIDTEIGAITGKHLLHIMPEKIPVGQSHQPPGRKILLDVLPLKAMATLRLFVTTVRSS